MNDLEVIASAIRTGNALLVIGSFFSKDAINHANRNLPSTDDFQTMLLTDLKESSESGDTLHPDYFGSDNFTYVVSDCRRPV